MSRPFSLRSRPALAVGLALLVMAPVQAGLLASRAGGGSAAPAPSRTPTADPAPTFPSPSPSPTEPSVAPRAEVFAGLGAWVDVYDYGALDPATAVATMKSHGVRTVYLQSARYRDTFEVKPGAGEWIAAAHAAGLKIVAWYYPGFGDLARDVRRVVAAAQFRHAGEGFDGVGIDVEEKGQVSDRDEWNARVPQLFRDVRAQIGDTPLAAITPTPLGMAIAGRNWDGFPWQPIAEHADAYMLLGYWTFRKDCANNDQHCAYGYTKTNAERVRELTRADMPVHSVGGVADTITPEDVDGFARAVREAGAIGASLYDFNTTSQALWERLAALAATFAP